MLCCSSHCHKQLSCHFLPAAKYLEHISIHKSARLQIRNRSKYHRHKFGTYSQYSYSIWRWMEAVSDVTSCMFVRQPIIHKQDVLNHRSTLRKTECPYMTSTIFGRHPHQHLLWVSHRESTKPTPAHHCAGASILKSNVTTHLAF